MRACGAECELLCARVSYCIRACDSVCHCVCVCDSVRVWDDDLEALLLAAQPSINFSGACAKKKKKIRTCKRPLRKGPFRRYEMVRCFFSIVSL